VTAIVPDPTGPASGEVQGSSATLTIVGKTLAPALAAVTFAVLAVAATTDGGFGLGWDRAVTDAAVNQRSTLLDDIAVAVTHLGSWVVAVPLGVALAFAAKQRSPELAVAIVVVVSTRPFVTWLLKAIVSRPRPGLGDRLADATGHSYPSGHVLAAAATWIFLPAVVSLYSQRRAVGMGAVAIATTVILAVAWSRVWLGVHWVTDVVGSLLLTAVALHAMQVWRRRWEAARDQASTSGSSPRAS
jgi:undecaprenyl-diphosphatase